MLNLLIGTLLVRVSQVDQQVLRDGIAQDDLATDDLDDQGGVGDVLKT